MYNVQNTSATGLFNQTDMHVSRIQVGDASQSPLSIQHRINLEGATEIRI